jgi:PAS domain S-box-containing protein
MKAKVLEAILDSIADGVFTVDRDWIIMSWNRAAETITGFAREEAIGKSCHDVFRANVCQTSCILRQTLASGDPLINIPINILTADGEQKPISISTAVMKDSKGNVIGGAETFRDLSEIETLRRRLSERYSFQDIISKNYKIREIFRILPNLAESGSTVLIQGSSGTGKELFARAIHNLSDRSKGPFIAVNCGALPDTLLESELFGYKAGAFTDAKKDKPGRFALAEKGTLFLDEIADISTALQVKLLRVLQEKSYEPLGASRSVDADVRIIAASNRDLREQMSIGRFRDDLYYRLNVIRVDLPPLSERKEDIPLLVDHFIERFNAEKGRDIQGTTPAAQAALMAYDFPGNVRELENAVEYAFVLCRNGLIDVKYLPPEICPHTSVDDVDLNSEGDLFQSAEAEVIRSALARNDGHRQRTADALGVHKTTLLRKMKRLAITYP